MDEISLGRRIAEARWESGLTQEEVAAHLGVTKAAVSKWERAESAPDMGNLMALADLYGVTIDELLRVDADIADDVRFECQDRRESAEAEAARDGVDEALFASIVDDLVTEGFFRREGALLIP